MTPADAIEFAIWWLERCEHFRWCNKSHGNKRADGSGNCTCGHDEALEKLNEELKQLKAQ